uniref:(northern house mosquito) hypothetical protein n=1 Tax=Culex pipiens TaxID=7175 RepID=A0A8D8EWZ9_CULPI
MVWSSSSSLETSFCRSTAASSHSIVVRGGRSAFVVLLWGGDSCPERKWCVAFALGYQTRDDRRPEHWHQLNTPRRARCTFIKVYFTQEKKRRAMIRFSDFDFLYLLFDR